MSASTNLAFVFPGQGSQYLGMLAELAREYAVVKTTFEEASAGAGADLWSISQEGPEELLNRTDNTQPALLAAGVAVGRVWQELPGAPAGAARGRRRRVARMAGIARARAGRPGRAQPGRIHGARLRRRVVAHGCR